MIGQGRAVAQAVSRWLPTAAARVRVRAACEVCGGQSGIGAGFLRVLRVPCQSFHQFLQHHNHPGLAQ
jgi:ribosomal protein S14